ncbi:MAG TPA: ankyrin repeat domain-containing protein [Burkholderiales bacterium]
MRTGEWMLALVAAALIAAPPARAQQQEPQQAPSEQPFPERVVDGIRGFFRSIFSQDRNQPAAPSPQEAQPSPPAQSQDPKEQEVNKRGTPYAQPVVASSHASPPPQSLQGAIAKGDNAGALKMIEGGVDIEAKDPATGATALHYAVMKGELALVGLLVQRGADVNSRTRSGTTPLHTAVLYGRYEVAEYLLDKGSQIDAKSASGATPLALAEAAHFERIAKMLKDRGAH